MPEQLILRRRPSSRRLANSGTLGVTLVELVVAIAVLSIATLAAVRTFQHAGRTVGGEAARALAHQVALNRIAELRHSGLAANRSLPDRVVMGPWEWTISVQNRQTLAGLIEVEITVTTSDQPGQRLLAWLTSEGSAR